MLAASQLDALIDCPIADGDVGQLGVNLGRSTCGSDGNESRKLECFAIKCCRGTATQSKVARVDQAICKVRG